MTLSIAERAAEIMEHLCSHSDHGYSQPNRQGIGTGGSVAETVTLSDGTRVGIAAYDRDCSSASIECYAAQGVDCGGATYTGNMRSCMSSTGLFEVLPASTWRSPQRGDLLLTERNGHVAMALGGGKLGEFLRSENHTIHGKVGDQDGGESVIRALYNDGWTCVLRYVGPERDQASDEPATEPAEEEEDMPTECLISIPQSGDMPCGVTVYVCGDRVHDLANPEVVKYLNEVYKACHGRDIPCFEMSASPDFPAFQRVLQGLRGGIPDTWLIPNVDCYEPRSGNRADGCTGTEGM